jgi:hypothetical protein
MSDGSPVKPAIKQRRVGTRTSPRKANKVDFAWTANQLPADISILKVALALWKLLEFVIIEDCITIIHGKANHHRHFHYFVLSAGVPA